MQHSRASSYRGSKVAAGMAAAARISHHATDRILAVAAAGALDATHLPSRHSSLSGQYDLVSCFWHAMQPTLRP